MRFILLLLICVAFKSIAQTGPGGVGNSTTNFVFMRSDVGTSTTTTGVGLTQWNDQSGNNSHFTQGVLAERPTYQASQLNGFPSVRFNGSNRMIGPSTFPTNSDYTKFIVGRVTNSSGNNFFSGTSGHAVYMSSSLFPRIYDQATFVTSSIALTLNQYAIITATYRNTTPTRTGQIFVNSASGGTGTTTVAPVDATMHLGSHNTGNRLNGDMTEVLGYNFLLNTAQRIIVENYLSAKYDLPILAANDVYTQDNPANGNYDYDVAGIGRVNATNIHNDARGTGFIRFLNPTDLEDGEYFMWGHDNGLPQATNTSDVPANVSARFARVWRVSETGGDGDVGSIDINIDVTGLADFNGLGTCDRASAITLLVDTDNDGLFSDQTPISGATNIGGNIYRFASVSNLSNGNRFTIAIVNSANGPGGVGNKASNFLFLRSDVGTSTTTNGASITTWNDQSGNGNNATAAGVGQQPTYLSNQLNGFPSVDFNGTTQFMTAPSNFPINSDFTKFVVGKIKSTTPFNNYFSGNGGHALFMNMASLNPQLYQSGIYAVSSQAMVLNQYSVLSNTWTHSTRVGEIFVAGISGGTGIAGSVNTDNAIQIGAFTGAGLLDGGMTEIIGYSFKLNTAQLIIVENYLAAKYNLPLGVAVDKYTRDNGPFNYDYDVAGIGKVDVNNQHRDARGTGIVRVSNPTDLDDGEFFMWGHQNGSLASTNRTDVPPGIDGRMNRVWSVSETGGDTGSIDIQFDLTGQNTIVASDLRLLIDDDGDGIFDEPSTIILSGANALSCNNYTFTVVSALNDGMGFTVGTVNFTQTPLPISLTSFTGKMVEGRTMLNWTTESELNNDYFEVERSSEAESFIPVNKVKGAGTSASTNHYEAVDEYPPSGKIYYRLKQVDYDGKFTYSKLIAVENNSLSLRLVISPNPVNFASDINVRLFQPQDLVVDQVSFVVYDLFGRSMPVTFDRLGGTDWILKIREPENLANSVYIVKMSIGRTGKTLVERVVFTK